MEKLVKVSLLTIAIATTGCATKHYAADAISGNVFRGDSKLSLAGNLELLAGNEKVEGKNHDEPFNQNDAFYLKAAGNYLSTNESDAFRAASLALTAKYIGNAAAVTELLSNPADYPTIGNVVLLKLSGNENPNTPEMLQKAFNTMTNPNSTLIKKAQCKMDDDALLCKRDDSKIGYMRFSKMVDLTFVKKLNPAAESGQYAAYGFENSVWTTSNMQLKDYRPAEPNVFIFSPSKSWYTMNEVNDQAATGFTYRVTEENKPDLKTVVYVYDKKFKDGKIAELR